MAPLETIIIMSFSVIRERVFTRTCVFVFIQCFEVPMVTPSAARSEFSRIFACVFHSKSEHGSLDQSDLCRSIFFAFVWGL